MASLWVYRQLRLNSSIYIGMNGKQIWICPSKSCVSRLCGDISAGLWVGLFIWYIFVLTVTDISKAVVSPLWLWSVNLVILMYGCNSNRKSIESLSSIDCLCNCLFGFVWLCVCHWPMCLCTCVLFAAQIQLYIPVNTALLSPLHLSCPLQLSYIFMLRPVSACFILESYKIMGFIELVSHFRRPINVNLSSQRRKLGFHQRLSDSAKTTQRISIKILPRGGAGPQKDLIKVFCRSRSGRESRDLFYTVFNIVR